MTATIPMPRRSRAALPGNVRPSTLPLTDAGTTYTMAQEATFLDDTQLCGRPLGRHAVAVRLHRLANTGAIDRQGRQLPAQEGIQAIVLLSPGVFASSNDDASILLRASATRAWTDLAVAASLAYDGSLGVANGGAPVTSNGTLCLVVSHANGFVKIWKQTSGPVAWSLAGTIGVRAANPVNPLGLHNVRGIAVSA